MIPGFLITWITFPGVVVHELAHELFCRLTGTTVREVCYFQFGIPSGYVIHDIPSASWKHLVIGFGPLIVNTLTGLIIALLSLPMRDATGFVQIIYLILMWFAISIAMHSFPSTGDAQSLWHGIWKQPSSVSTKLIGTPLIALIYLGALGSVFWLDLIYGVSICIGIPELLHLR